MKENEHFFAPPVSPFLASMIDFGAGTGRLAVLLSREGYPVTVVESSSGMLNEMKITDPAYAKIIKELALE
jgi:16S rRNA A1518/A1519 N6-dimethyltransferase RsmA/KsgA/DIM1 with predicted DNA glycosylase/AP lyase activity